MAVLNTGKIQMLERIDIPDGTEVLHYFAQWRPFLVEGQRTLASSSLEQSRGLYLCRAA